MQNVRVCGHHSWNTIAEVLFHKKEKKNKTKKTLGILMYINVFILIYCVSNINMYIAAIHAVNFSSNIIIMT